jgi:hypothetical protein
MLTIDAAELINVIYFMNMIYYTERRLALLTSY